MEIILICIFLMLIWYNFKILDLKNNIRRLQQHSKLLEESFEIEKLLRPKMSDVNEQIDFKLKLRDFENSCKEYKELLNNK